MITLVGSFKGGSGKSTVTFNLGVWLSVAGKNVIAYDLDPQCTLSDVAEVRKEEGFKPPLTVSTRAPAKWHSDVDEILIDVGTADMKAMKKALSISERVLLPVGPSQADIWSAQRFLYLIASLQRDKPLPIMAFINRADTNPGIRESDEAAQVLQTLPGIQVLTQRLCQRTAYRRSFSEGMGVFELEANSKAADEFSQFAAQVYPSVVATG
jgi:chromosome partitioning protein